MHEQWHIEPVHWSRVQLLKSEEGVVCVSARACWREGGKRAGDRVVCSLRELGGCVVWPRPEAPSPKDTACLRPDGRLPSAGESGSLPLMFL